MSLVHARRRPTRPHAALFTALVTLGAPSLAAAVAAPLGAQARAHAAAAAPLGDSYSYTFRITTGDGDPVTGVTHVLGNRSRIEITAEKGKARSEYLLVTPNGRLQVVKPSERSYAEIDADAFERIVGRAIQAVDRAMTFELDDVDVTGRRLGDGGTVAGFAAERSRVSQAFDLRVGVLGFTNSSRHRIDTEYWTTKEVRLPRNPLIEMFVSIPSVMALHDRGYLKRTAVAREALVGKGTPLRVVVTSRSEDEDGKNKQSETRIEILRITPARHDAARFALPAGYEKTDEFSWQLGMDGGQRWRRR